jgi:hypothetical protein
MRKLERPLCAFIQRNLQCGLVACVREVLEPAHWHADRHSRRNDLEGQSIALFNATAQRCVALDERLQAALKRAGVKLAAQAHGLRDVISSVRTKHAIQKPQPLLGRRER